MADKRDQIRAEALEAIRLHRCAGAAISMGVGKTRLGLDHFQLVMKKILENGRDARGLIVAPKLDILKGWQKEAKKWNVENLLDHLTFTTYRSMTKYNTNDFDVVYLDECHSLTPAHDFWLSHFPGWIIGLTGTAPKRKSSIKQKLVNKHCPIMYEYITDDAVEDNILNDYRIIVHLLSLDPSETMLIEKGGRRWYTSEVKNYAYWTKRLITASGPKEKQIVSVQRMKAMQTYPSKDEYAKQLLDSIDQKCLLFANEKKQADKLCDHSYHSGNKDSKENMKLFESGEITKMSCVLQLSEGVNIPGLKEGIIMHAYGNNRKSAQRIGRLLRLNPDDVATAHILCYKGTVDLDWVKSALEDFDDDKISWYDTEEF